MAAPPPLLVLLRGTATSPTTTTSSSSSSSSSSSCVGREAALLRLVQHALPHATLQQHQRMLRYARRLLASDAGQRRAKCVALQPLLAARRLHREVGGAGTGWRVQR